MTDEQLVTELEIILNAACGRGLFTSVGAAARANEILAGVRQMQYEYKALVEYSGPDTVAKALQQKALLSKTS